MAFSGAAKAGGRTAAEQEAEEAIGKAKKKARGRKDSTGQEMAIDHEGLKDDFPALKKAYQKSLKAADDFSTLVKDKAEERHANAAVVKRWLKAACDGKFEERRRKSEQESDLFAMGNPDPESAE